MAQELLVVPEEKLFAVIRVIRAGLKVERLSRDTREQLEKWCADEEEYVCRSTTRE